MLRHLKQSSTLLAVGFAILALTIAAALGVSFGQANDERWVRHTLEVEYRIANLLARLQDAEAAQRGFLITGDESYLGPYEEVRRTLSADLDQLAEDVDDNPRQAAALSRLRPVIDQRLESLATGIRLRRTEGFEPAIAYLAQGRGKALMEEIRRQTRAMRQEESQLLAQRQAQLRNTRVGLQAVLVGGFIGLVGLTVFAVRDSRRRFAELRAQAFARAGDPAFDRSDGDAEDVGDLFVGKVLYVAQDENLAVLG